MFRLVSFGAVILLLLCTAVPNTEAIGWDAVDQLLVQGIADRTTPGLQALVADHSGILYHKTFGNFTYGAPTPLNHDNPPVTFSTIYDMASLTKVLATTTVAMMLYDAGVLDLDRKVSDATLLGPDFAQRGKGPITIRNLLLHNSGFPPDPVPGYGAVSFGCPETAHYHPKLSFSCIPKIYTSLMAQTLQNPVGAVYVYSDLSMITASFVFGKLAMTHNLIQRSELLPSCANELRGVHLYHCYFEAFLRTKIIAKIGMTRSGFLLSPDLYSQATPTWNDTVWRHELLQGVVSDENAYASGGFAGHAGLWSTSSDTYLLGKSLMFGTELAKRSTVEMFTKIYNVTQSSRALGWDTNNYKMNTYRGCASLSQETYMHTGYTGTQICCDPKRNLMTILLTNRVYPGKTNSSQLIQLLRQKFNKAVQQIYDSKQFTVEIAEGGVASH